MIAYTGRLIMAIGVAFVISINASAALAPVLVKDLAPGTAEYSEGFAPNILESTPIVFDDFVLYPLLNVEGHLEMWRTNFQPDGFKRVKRVMDYYLANTSYPRRSGFSQAPLYYPLPKTVAGKALFILFNKYSDQAELWQCDGTEAGTSIVKTFDAPWDPISEGDVARWIGADGAAYFVLPFLNKAELWKCAGTTATTELVATMPFNDTEGTVVRRVMWRTGETVTYLIFTDDNGTNAHVWRTTGTTAGTVSLALPLLVRNTTPFTMLGDDFLFVQGQSGNAQSIMKLGPAQSFPTYVNIFDAALEPYFLDAPGDLEIFGVKSGNTQQIWSTDGTDAGTQLLTIVDTMNEISRLAKTDSAYVFVAGSYLWKTDGSPKGTAQVREVFSAPSEPCTELPRVFFLDTMRMYRSFPVFEDQVYFTGLANISCEVSNDLWISDGTFTGTKNITADATNHGYSLVTAVEFHGQRYILGADDEHHAEWYTLGDELGETEIIADVSQNPGNPSYPRSLCSTNDGLVFVANRNQLMITNGTPGTTRKLFDSPGEIHDVEYLNGHILVMGGDVGARYIYDVDPLNGDTATVHFNTNTTWPTDPMTIAGGFAWFNAVSNGKYQLWRTDGTPGGTTPTTYSALRTVLQPDNHEFIWRVGMEFGGALWSEEMYYTSDGSNWLFLENVPPRRSMMRATSAGLFFGASWDYFTDYGQLWHSDGTVGGTRQLVPAFGPAHEVHFVTALDDLAVFSAHSPGGFPQLWRSDGTDEGSFPITNISYPVIDDVRASEKYQGPWNLQRDGDDVYYTLANTGQLWRTRGNAEDTEMICDFDHHGTYLLEDDRSTDPGAWNINVTYKTIGTHNGDIYCAAFDAQAGFELFRLAVDSDADGLADEVEQKGDADSDGTQNYLDMDSNNNGVNDREDGVHDSDGDGVANYLDLDLPDLGLGHHLSLDWNQSMSIDISELLRAVQFFNSDGYHCDAAGEDGYNPGAGDQSCIPLNNDYAPLDWQITISELLRVVQFFNSLGYQRCAHGEDGFCIIIADGE